MRTAELRFKISEKQILPFQLNEKVTTLGRHPENAIVIDNKAIASFHAEIHFNSSLEEYEIVDMGSPDGTKVNGEKIMRRHLKNGDTIYFGQVVAELVIESLSEKGKPSRQTTPEKKKLVKSSRSAMPTPGRLLVKSMPTGHEANSLKKNVARTSDTPHKIKKAKPPVAKKVSNNPQAEKAATQTKLNIELPTLEKSMKAPQKTPKPE